MGFLYERALQIFKGPGATRLKERYRAGKAEKFAARAKHLLFEDFPKVLEGKHDLDKFLQDLVEFVEDCEKAGKSALAVLFNELTQDLTEEKEIDKFLDALEKFWHKLPKEFMDKVKYYIIKAAKELEKEDLRERAEYWEVSALINEAKNVRGDKEALMNKIRTFFKKRASLVKSLERVAWRREISGSRRGIKRTHGVVARFEQTLRKMMKAKNTRKLEPELEAELAEVCKDVMYMFNESYLVRERSILLLLKIMYMAETCDAYVRRMVNEYLAPDPDTKKIEDKLEHAMQKIGKQFHDVIEQGFRISIAKLEKEDKRFKRLAKAT